MIVNGSGRIKVDDEIVELKQWDAIRVPGEATRNLEAGADGIEYVAIGAPQADDTEMVQGWWGD